MSNFESHMRWSKQQRYGILLLLLITICLYAMWAGVFWLYKPPQTALQVVYLDSNDKPARDKTRRSMGDFDPNALDRKGWVALGFSDKQAKSILKYKSSLGGAFSSKQELQASYVIDESKWSEIAPFVTITPRTNQKKVSKSKIHKKSKYSRGVQSNFDPNELDEKGWERIGFSTKQAKSILKFKHYLGGRFTSKAQIAKCYVISHTKFKEIAPYIAIKPTIANKPQEQSTKKPKSRYRIPNEKLDPNTLSRSDWISFGFSPKQVNTIFNYKRSLGGSFKDWKQFARCYALDAVAKSLLKPVCVFTVKNKEPKVEVTKIIPNTKTINEIIAKEVMPFVSSRKVAYTLVNYRRSLGGFKQRSEILKVYGIASAEVDSLLKYYPLELSK